MARPIWNAEVLSERPAFVANALGGEHAAQQHERNVKGRDFVVSDIHGMFAELKNALDDLMFDLEVDRLFAVGDLIDRGPRSSDAIDWLQVPWFLPVRGNHDQYLLDAVADPDGYNGEESILWRCYNGGDWWDSVVKQGQDEFVMKFAMIPFARQVECDAGLVGIVHADVPEDRNWMDFTAALRAGSREDCYHAIWSRRRHELLGVPGFSSPPVEGVDVVFCGHTVVRRRVQICNIWCIDTGAAYHIRLSNAGFTIAQIHPGEIQWYFHAVSRQAEGTSKIGGLARL